MMHTIDLVPMHDSRKSFNGKARVVEFSHNEDEQPYKIELHSYNTVAATLDISTADTTVMVHNMQSATTLRHVREFLKQSGFKATTKKQIQEDYM